MIMRIVFATIIILCVFDLSVQAQEEDNSGYQRCEKQLKSGILCKRREITVYSGDTVNRIDRYTDSVFISDFGLCKYYFKETYDKRKSVFDTIQVSLTQYDKQGRVIFEKYDWESSVRHGKIKEERWEYDTKGRQIKWMRVFWDGDTFTRHTWSYVDIICDNNTYVTIASQFNQYGELFYRFVEYADSSGRTQTIYPVPKSDYDFRDVCSQRLPKVSGEDSVTYEYIDSGKTVVEYLYVKELPYQVETTTKTDSFVYVSTKHMWRNYEPFQSSKEYMLYEVKYNMNGDIVESKTTDLTTGKVELYNDSTDVKMRIYNTNRKLISRGAGDDRTFSGIKYAYNERGDMSEMIKYQNGKIIENHKLTYTYAK